MPTPSTTSSADGRVTVVTVTYGDRWDSGLSSTITSVLADERADVIVVSNGASVRVQERLRECADRAEGRLEVILFASNRGSAPAFSAALAAAYRRDTPVLILDDDNPLPAGALHGLQAVVAGLGAGDGERVAVACFRAVNPVHTRLRSGVSPRVAFAELRPGAFLSTDVFRRRVVARTSSITDVRTELGVFRVVDLPNAMWGGLYLPRPTAALCVLPPEDFVLYADDNAFSARLRAAGVDIWLCLDIEIRDTTDWRATAEPPRSRFRLPRILRTADADLWRVRYQYRNAAFLSAQQAGSSPAARVRLAVNVGVRLGLLFVAAVIARRLPVFLAILHASVDGLRGRLGHSYPLPGDGGRIGT
ncbi:glycosyltransferase [Microbacterium testaceum]|uniref:glycosyltransferase n=1 Tax=Microbacterium testaceum TaxID=2033 RepID=UPI003448F04F